MSYKPKNIFWQRGPLPFHIATSIIQSTHTNCIYSWTVKQGKDYIFSRKGFVVLNPRHGVVRIGLPFSWEWLQPICANLMKAIDFLFQLRFDCFTAICKYKPVTFDFSGEFLWSFLLLNDLYFVQKFPLRPGKLFHDDCVVAACLKPLLQVAFSNHGPCCPRVQLIYLNSFTL